MNDDKNLEYRFRHMIDNPTDATVTLFYIDQADRLTDEQLEWYFDGSDEAYTSLMENIGEIEDDWFHCNLDLGYYDDDLDRILPGFFGFKRELEEADEWSMATELWETGLDLLRERDDSNILRDLARNTPNVLVQYGNLEEDVLGFQWEQDNLKENLETLFEYHGIDLDNETNRRAIDDLVDMNIYVHEGLHLRVLNYADPYEFDLVRRGEPVIISTAHPTLVLLDAWHGCFSEATIDGTLSTVVNRVQLDSKAPGYGSVMDIAGVYAPAYAADFTIVTTN